MTSARNNYFSWDKKNLKDIISLYQKQSKSRFLKNFHE